MKNELRDTTWSIENVSDLESEITRLGTECANLLRESERLWEESNLTHATLLKRQHELTGLKALHRKLERDKALYQKSFDGQLDYLISSSGIEIKEAVSRVFEDEHARRTEAMESIGVLPVTIKITKVSEPERKVAISFDLPRDYKSFSLGMTDAAEAIEYLISAGMSLKNAPQARFFEQDCAEMWLDHEVKDDEEYESEICSLPVILRPSYLSDVQPEFIRFEPELQRILDNK